VKVAAACALSALGLVMLGHRTFGPESGASAHSESSSTIATESATFARKINANRSDSLDPTLRISQLELTEHGVYEGSGRNIFQSDWEDKPEKWRPEPKKPQSTTGATTTLVTSAPPIGLTFFGIATTLGSPRKICLAQDRDIFIGAEGDIVDRRYKILRIGPSTIAIEDLLENKEYTLTLP